MSLDYLLVKHDQSIHQIQEKLKTVITQIINTNVIEGKLMNFIALNEKLEKYQTEMNSKNKYIQTHTHKYAKE